MRLFGGSARVTLKHVSGLRSRVHVRSIRLRCLAIKSLKSSSRRGIERTWCLSYTDASCRVVRAGVGGRSVVHRGGNESIRTRAKRRTPFILYGARARRSGLKRKRAGELKFLAAKIREDPRHQNESVKSKRYLVGLALE